MSVFTTRPADGVILKDGQPWFPVGFYHVSHFPADDDRRFRDMGTMALQGFNAIATPLTPTSANRFLQRGGDLGVNCLVEGNDTGNEAGFLSMVAANRDKPGLMGWQVFDDVDARNPDKTQKYTPEQVTALCQKVKAADPIHLTYVSAGLKDLSLRYVGCADVFGMQSYPIPDESWTSTYNLLRAAVVAAAVAKRIVIANIQCFAWEGKRPPTPQEMRTMVYCAIAAGVKGVFFYTFYDPKWVLLDHRELWNECIKLSRELGSLGRELVK